MTTPDRHDDEEVIQELMRTQSLTREQAQWQLEQMKRFHGDVPDLPRFDPKDWSKKK